MKKKFFVVIALAVIVGLALTGCVGIKDRSYSLPTVDSVTISTNNDISSILTGRTLQFNAVVTGTNNPAQNITWSVSSTGDGIGDVTAGTNISPDGLLTVSDNETVSFLFIRGTSTSNPNIFDYMQIRIITITGVTVISNSGNRLARGRTTQINAEVLGTNNPDNAVMWRVSSNAAGTGAVAAGTNIDHNGLLTVAIDEIANTLFVTAISIMDPSKSGIISMTIPTVINVTIRPTSAIVNRGAGTTFTATVQGTGGPSQEIIWSVDGVNGPLTASSIASNGMIIVGASEARTQLIVTATSVDDPSKSGSAMVTIR
ncbi:MAG: hypothetical protein FWD13_12870 [Treponema sp.]|nr:hypothetical protein [Treponema sp.]